MKATTRTNPKKALPLLGALLLLTFFLLLSCDDVESDDDKDAPSSITLSGKGASGSLHLGDGVKADDIITLSAKLKGVTAITWKILDNTADKYGTIDQATSRYKAPKVWKEAVPAGGIQFTIEASSTADPSVKVSRPVTIKTDSFPNALVIRKAAGSFPDNRASYSNYSGTNKDIVIYLGVTEIRDAAFQNLQLTSVTIPESVTAIGNSAFLLNSLSRLVLPASLRSLKQSSFRANSLSDVRILSPSLSGYIPVIGPFIENEADMSVAINASLWQTMKDNPTLFFQARAVSYTDLDGNKLLGISIDTSSPRAVVVGSTITLTATTIEAGRAITWTVDDDLIATIDATTGVLTGVAAGTVTVTATTGIITVMYDDGTTATSDGLSDTVEVTVQ